MKTSVRTIMNARAKQRKNALVVQGFKCHEITEKRKQINNPLKDYAKSILTEKKPGLMKKVMSIFSRKRK